VKPYQSQELAELLAFFSVISDISVKGNRGVQISLSGYVCVTETSWLLKRAETGRNQSCLYIMLMIQLLLLLLLLMMMMLVQYRDMWCRTCVV